MSKSNIKKLEDLPNGRLRATFQDRQGNLRQYEYGSVAAKQIKKGKDPSTFRSREVKS